MDLEGLVVDAHVNLKDPSVVLDDPLADLEGSAVDREIKNADIEDPAVDGPVDLEIRR